jgi:hypothetical protein
MYGDGGAFPEIHMAQYPLNMGLTKNQTSNAIQLQVDADGKPKFDAIVKQNVKGSKVSCSLSLSSFCYYHFSFVRLFIQVLSIYYPKKFVKMILVYKNHLMRN